MAESYHAIVRHGAYRQRPGAPSARQPFALSDEGLRQASDCGDALAGMLAEHGLSLDPVVHASRQLRAWQTASGIAGQLRAHGHRVDEIRETSALAERGLGSAANLTVAEIEAVLAGDPRFGAPPPGWKSDSDYRLPLEGAESLSEAGVRVAGHLRAVAEAATGGALTVHVGHGASFRHACAHLGILRRDEVAGLSMFHARALLLCYRGHGRWYHVAGTWKIRAPKDAPVD